uniref:Uncharacterized protein n=1 Tax=Anopheles dirus TaxID=7168 RepID=A0A182NXD5_9DIPT
MKMDILIVKQFKLKKDTIVRICQSLKEEKRGIILDLFSGNSKEYQQT